MEDDGKIWQVTHLGLRMDPNVFNMNTQKKVDGTEQMRRSDLWLILALYLNVLGFEITPRRRSFALCNFSVSVSAKVVGISRTCTIRFIVFMRSTAKPRWGIFLEYGM